MSQPFNNKLKLLATVFLSLVGVIILGQLMSIPAKATHIPGNWVPSSAEVPYLAGCTQAAVNGFGYTVHGAFPNPSSVTTSTGSASTNLYGASLVCDNAPYTTVTNINITVTGFSRTEGTGNISIGALPSGYSLGSVTARNRYTAPVSKPVSLSNLSQGRNCWDVYFNARATYGGVEQTANGGRWNFCVNVTWLNWNYTPTIAPATGEPANEAIVAPNDEITLNGRILNWGPNNGPAFNFRMKSINGTSTTYAELICASWNNPSTNTWGNRNGTNCPAATPQPATTTDTVQWGKVGYGGGGIAGISAGQWSPATRQATFRILPNTPDGTRICFATLVSNYNNTASGTNWRAVPSAAYICYTVRVTPPTPPDFAYMKIRGSGAQNGAVWDTLEGCQIPRSIGPTASVQGQIRDDIGTSVEYGLTSATSLVENFASAIVADRQISDQESLTFANDPNAGEFLASTGGTGSPAKCLVDLYNELNDPSIPTQAFGGAGGIRISSSIGYIINNEDVSSNAYLARLNGNSLVAIDNFRGKAVVLVDGDLNINGNITYDPNYGTAANLQVPSLVFIVKGDINIAAGVTRLDGLYMSIPDGSSGGIINTCLQATNTALPDTCNDAQLTVNGAFVADDVDFYRFIYGQAYAESQVALGSSQDQFASEIFEFSPELYIARPFAGLLDSRNINQQRYDFYIERAPVF